MTFELLITESDYLTFQLFTASQSARIKKRIRNGRYFLSIGCFLFSIYFFVMYDTFMSIFMLFIGMMWWLFYRPYIKYFLKRSYKAHIREHFENKLNINVLVKIEDDHIFTSDKTGEGIMKLSEIEKVDEISTHFFVKISTGHSFIFPKSSIKNPEIVRDKFSTMGLKINNLNNWKW